MQCEHAQELFSDYVTGEIDRALTVSIENHLSVCQECRETVEELRQAWSMLDRMPVVEPPPDFHATLMSRLAEAQSQAEAAVARPAARGDWRALFRPRTLAFAATILILIMAGAEVVQTQRAALGPLGWVLNQFRPAPPALQTALAEWTPDPVAGGGMMTVHLKANPTSVLAPTRFNYRLTLRTQRLSGTGEDPAKQGELRSDRETTVTWHAEAPPSEDAAALKVELSPAEESGDSNTQTLPIPIVTRSNP